MECTRIISPAFLFPSLVEAVDESDWEGFQSPGELVNHVIASA